MANEIEAKIREMIGYICDGIQLAGNYPEDWLVLGSALAEANRSLMAAVRARKAADAQLHAAELSLQA